MRESIFFAAIRAFFVTLFAVVGIAFGFLVLVVILGAFSGGDQITSKNSFSPQIVANALGERKNLGNDAPVILKANIEGFIGMDNLTAPLFQQMLIESREGALANNRVKAILVRINTSGGTVTDADGIYRALKAYRAQYHTPIIAYVDGLCLSGGMYIAAAADKIYSNDAGLIGSVGAILPPFFNASNLMEKIGLQAQTIYAGKGKDEMNPTRPWKPGEQENLSTITQQYYEQFVNIVSTSRPLLTKEKLIGQYGARLFIAKEALANGYIDHISTNFEEALTALAEEAGLTEGTYQVVELSNTDWFSRLFSKHDGMVSKAEQKLLNALPLELNPNVAGHVLYLHR
jgi:protease-4